MKLPFSLAIWITLFIVPAKGKSVSDTLLPVKKNGKWGYINQNGQIRIPFQYDAALYWGSGLFGKVKKGPDWLLINRAGEIIPARYQGNPVVFNDSVTVISTPEGDLICDELGNPIIKQHFKQVKSIGNGLFTFMENDSVGLGSLQNGILIRANFNSLEIDQSGKYVISKTCEQVGLFKIEGEELLSPQFNEIRFLDDDLLEISLGQENLKGVFSLKANRFIVEPTFDEIVDWNNNFIVLEQDNLNRIYFYSINKIDTTRHNSVFLDEDIAYVLGDKGEGVISKSGNYLFLPEYASIELKYENFLTSKDGTYKFFTNDGVQALKQSFTEVRLLNTPNWLVQIDDKDWMLLDRNLKTLRKGLWDPQVQNNIIKSGKAGEILRLELDSKGSIIETSSYSNVLKISVNAYKSDGIYRQSNANGLLGQTVDSRWFYDFQLRKWGLKGLNGELQITPSFDNINNLSNSQYTVVYQCTPKRDLQVNGEFIEISAKAGLVDLGTGKIIIDPEFVDIIFRGTNDKPLIFAITNSLKFKQYFPSRNEFGQTYSWVDNSIKTPIRALLSTDLCRLKYKRSNSPKLVPNILAELNNPYLETHYLRHTKLSLTICSSNIVWTYLTENGNLPGYFSQASAFTSENVALVEDRNTRKMGIINTQTGYNLEPEYTNILASGMMSNQGYRLSKEGEIFSVIKDGVGVTNIDRMIKFIPYKDSIVYFETENGKGFWSPLNGIVNIPNASQIQPFASNLAPIKVNNKWGYINKSGEIVIPCIYSKVIGFHNNWGAVKHKGLWRKIDREGNLTDTLPFKEIKEWNSFVFGKIKNEWSMLDQNFEENKSIPKFNSYCKDIETGNLITYAKNKATIISPNYSVVGQSKCNRLENLGHQNYLFYKGKRMYIQFDGKTPRRYKDKNIPVQVFGNRMWVKKGEAFSFTDTAGNELSKENYLRFTPIANNLTAGLVKNKWNILDMEGNVLCQSEHPVYRFLNKDALIFKESNQSYVIKHLDGQKYPIYSIAGVYCHDEKQIWLKINGLWGMVDQNIEWIIEPQYDSIFPLGNGLIGAVQLKTNGYASGNGRLIIPSRYPFLKALENGIIRAESSSEVHWYYPDGRCIYGPEMVKPLADSK